MPTIGNIELPITGPIKAEGTDMDMIDIMFDLKVEFEQYMNKLDAPTIYVIKATEYGLIVMLMYWPPDIWLDFDGQKYQVYLSPSLPLMIHYFQDRRMRVNDTAEYQHLTVIVDYLSKFLPTEIHTTIKP